MVVWLCLASLLVGAYSECPLVQCAELQSGVCARGLDLATLQINSLGCPKGTSCLAQGVDSWWMGLTQPIGAVMPCLPANTTLLTEAQEYPYYYCGEREELKSFASKRSVIECDQDEDCVLEDGSYARCICGLRSDSTSGYCQPSFSSSVFDAFWSTCENGFTQDYALALYQTQTWKLFPYLQYSASCAKNLFYDLQVYGQLEYQQVTASAVTLGILAIVQL